MLKDITATCPNCGQTTILAVAAPDPGDSAEKQAAVTSCRKCRARILAVTPRDGTVQLALFDPESPPAAPLQAAATLTTAFGLSEVVRIPYALWQPRGAEIGEFSHRPEWAGALRDALHEAQARPRPLSVPRRIFISYRWGDPDDDAWVDALRRELEARGNLVWFDRQMQLEPAPPTVPEIVARIAACHMFLAVLDPGYIERVAAVDSAPRAEGWVTDEFHTALAFARKGMVMLMGLLREGDVLPAAFRAFAPGEAGNTFDVREPGALAEVLDRYFVQFGQAPEPHAAALAAAALHASRLALEAGDGEGALQRADEACALLPEVADGFAQRARLAYGLGQPARALEDARHAFGIDPTLDEMLIYGSAAANDLGESREAARLGRVALERNRTQANAHYLVGKALNELDQVDAAIAHFEVARNLGLGLRSLYNDAGWAWRRAAEPARGLSWYLQGLARAPGDEALLANATAAAMEANRPTQAVQLLQQLAGHHPGSRQLAVLAPILAQWCEQDDLPPPVLSRRVARPAPLAMLTCTRCSARIPLPHEDAMVCAGCGALLPAGLGVLEPCPCCGADGKVVPGLGFQCPYCSVGTVDRVPAGSG